MVLKCGFRHLCFFIVYSLLILFFLIPQAQTDWLQSICGHQFLSLAKDLQRDLGLDFDKAILTLLNVLI